MQILIVNSELSFFCAVLINQGICDTAWFKHSAYIVLAKERHSKGERVPFSACFQLVSKLKSEAASTLSLMFQIFLEKNYRTPWFELP